MRSALKVRPIKVGWGGTLNHKKGNSDRLLRWRVTLLQGFYLRNHMLHILAYFFLEIYHASPHIRCEFAQLQ